MTIKHGLDFVGRTEVFVRRVDRRACPGWDRATGRFHHGNSQEATTGKCHRWKADRRRILSSEYAQVFVATGCDPPPSARAVEAPLDPGRSSPPPTARRSTRTRTGAGGEKLQRKLREMREPRPRTRDYR